MMSRVCDACAKPITTRTFVELSARRLVTSGAEVQDAIDEQCWDYCDECIITGRALADVRNGLRRARQK